MSAPGAAIACRGGGTRSGDINDAEGDRNDAEELGQGCLLRILRRPLPVRVKACARKSSRVSRATCRVACDVLAQLLNRARAGVGLFQLPAAAAGRLGAAQRCDAVSPSGSRV